MTRYSPITGLPCDENHPYPAPVGADWVDSMEFGDEHRLSRDRMYNRDTTPAWRAVAAYLWGAPCLPQHIDEVAADQILTTYLIAAAAMSLNDADLHAPWRFGLATDTAGAVFKALRKGGLPAARVVVNKLDRHARAGAVEEAVRFANDRFVAMRLDAAARFRG